MTALLTASLKLWTCSTIVGKNNEATPPWKWHEEWGASFKHDLT